MTLTIDVPPEVQKQLNDAAALRGVPVEQATVDFLRGALDRAARAAARLQSWVDEGDAEEQSETFEYLARVLDEDRPSYRKLFPPEKKGVTW